MQAEAGFERDCGVPYDFPILAYHTDLSLNPMGIKGWGWHWHEELQFYLVTEGSVIFYVQDKQYLMQKGEGLFINTGRLHMSRRAEPDTGAKYLCLNISPLLFYLFRGSAIEKKYYVPLLAESTVSAVALYPQTDWQKEILNACLDIDTLMNRKTAGFEAEVCSRLCHIWALLVPRLPAQKSAGAAEPENRVVKQLLSYIAQHYADPLTLEELAGRVYLNKSTCCRIFKRALGCTLWQYLSEYRIRQSLTLLAEKGLSAADTAAAVGIPDAAYFSRLFRHYMGVSPLQFRRREQELKSRPTD